VEDRSLSVSAEQEEPTFGARLRWLRESVGLTQEELASRAGLTSNGVSALERGQRKRPYPHTVRSLADALGLTEQERRALLATVPKRSEPASFTAEEKPPPASSAPVVSALPRPTTPLVGREREVGEVRGLLTRPDVRLVTLTGIGGVGKTRLAVDAAREASGLFPGGVAFVPLASLRDPALVVSTIGRSLGLREAEGQSPHETLHAYLRDKYLLLVLDNFEQLLEAAPEVAGLIEACPDLVVLTTSRAPLRVRGEHEYPVPPLALPSSTQDPTDEEILTTSSGRLFVERARAASPSFALTNVNAPSVAAICWRVAGLPLALELAAAKVRLLEPAALLSRLDQALSMAWARDLPERQRTMRATLDWSHDLLNEPERELFRRLSVFTGGFTLEAAETIAETVGTSEQVEEVLGLLGALVEHSLIVVQPPMEGGEARYWMLEPVKQYAREKLEESGEAERVGTRHAEYYLALAERARPELQGPRQAQWLDWLAREHDNVRTVMAWLLERGKPEEVVRIGWGIYEFWFRRGYMGEGQRWMERVLAEGGALPALARSRALFVAAILSFLRGDLPRAVAAAVESVAAARAAGDPETLAYALGMHGLAALSRGDLDTAEAVLPEALALFRELGDPQGVSSGLYCLANLALARGDGGEAMRLIGESETLARKAGNWSMLATCLGTQAISTRLEGDDSRTAELLRESVEIAGMLRDDYNVVFCATGLAGVAARRGRPERAARLFGVADALSEKTGAGVSWSVLRSLNERDLAVTREQLDPEAFETAWAEGRAMTIEEAVAYALSEAGAQAGQDPKARI
jgi:predicted ATPase/transcriptional regulator with XRE-family HTH domain